MRRRKTDRQRIRELESQVAKLRADVARLDDFCEDPERHPRWGMRTISDVIAEETSELVTDTALEQAVGDLRDEMPDAD